jgi:hypothetical protein
MVSLREAGLPRASPFRSDAASPWAAHSVPCRPVRTEAARTEGDRVGGVGAEREGLGVGSG